MYRSYLLAAAVTVTFLFGCAPMDNKPGDPAEEKTHITGSRLPVRDGATSASVDSSDQRNSAIGGWVPAGNVSIPPKGGAH
jgi:hypothetical protein